MNRTQKSIDRMLNNSESEEERDSRFVDNYNFIIEQVSEPLHHLRGGIYRREYRVRFMPPVVLETVVSSSDTCLLVTPSCPLYDSRNLDPKYKASIGSDRAIKYARGSKTQNAWYGIADNLRFLIECDKGLRDEKWSSKARAMRKVRDLAKVADVPKGYLYD